MSTLVDETMAKIKKEHRRQERKLALLLIVFNILVWIFVAIGEAING